MSVNATSRITGADKKTILKLLVAAGEACSKYQDETIRGIKASKVQCDEVWSFVGAKDRQVKRGAKGPGSVWTWTAIDADSKLMLSWYVGNRDAQCALELMQDLASRLATRVQLTTDGHAAYLSAVPGAFGLDVDYAQLIKLYGEGPQEESRRYSPAVCLGTERKRVIGFPNADDISTSYIERSNLTIRMHNRRFTRLTNAFSKKLANHVHSLALFTMFYNFGRVHATLRCTPAMEAGVADHIWTLEEIAGLIEDEDVVILR